MTVTSDDRPLCLVEAGYGIGDVIVATSACRALWLLGYEVDFLVNRPHAEDLAVLFRGHPSLRRVLTNVEDADPASYAFGVACHGPGEAVRRLPRPMGLSVLMGDIARHGLLLANMSVPRALDYGKSPPPAALHLSSEPSDVAPGTIVVHAGSDPISLFKRWPHWEALCERLRALGHPVTVVGTSGDRSPSGWESRFDPRFDLPLEQVARILRDARAYLGNDSGVSHLADAVGTPSLLLFGPTDPRLYAPRSPTVRVIDAGGDDAEARHPFSKTYPTLEHLSFDDVLAEVVGWLEQAHRAEPLPAPIRQAAPVGDPSVQCPTRDEIAAAPATAAAVDHLFQCATRAAVLGALARRMQPSELASWRREAARAFGDVHLRAADAWKTVPTEFARRRERSHLRLAWRMGRSARAFARRALASVFTTRAEAPAAESNGRVPSGARSGY